jgi:hypothetical protein
MPFERSDDYDCNRCGKYHPLPPSVNFRPHSVQSNEALAGHVALADA